ncbi:nucleoporin p54-like isoform X2 [Amphibalanus amphitrite]|uniref:nucleoporin p54-like isoform X2 n=1 Tax=Amphibalanus amphitrite TaxID=1232801 RepID=UPI001C929403|nr:nucleoporin p54-like isoform X2 [Amphibalanus amphitrite]XP_043195040.1 nucleoporin p54-like isoform X2 [Amphibalanus amphitrite]XP_043195041.1 nucleoporin p54-like isoform X2 [Amphibalanus amphitrite]XP_043195042.1 nucleoporin p54-like isoform X2 [Amphibalanus amphitrite]XP_043195043.1 nucleoporin p54-like isoform X2 [Amphibalanus amphitrite]XP_043195044.1 nucleoporin p54-like isoform X2 [Amphibalanus amphitrite]XP_043195045.1 nucleoporin p54-like isoform X2 [Amphibalanus amphitrite]XP_0
MSTFTGFSGFGAASSTSTATPSGSLFGSATTTPSFSGFGASTAAKPSTGLSFGAPAASAATGFSFGAPAATTAATGFSFGAPAASTAATGFSFGAPASSASTGFSFGAPASSAATGFSFGAPASTASTGFSFGAPTFGAAAPAAGGFSFGKPAAPAFGALGQPQQPQQAQPADQSQTPALYSAMLNVTIYRDERDAILAKWNQLQAKWGVGKGFYTMGPPVELGAENPFCVMKAVGYARLPTAKNDDGLVTLRLNKKESEVRSSQQQIVSTVSKLLENRPSLSVCVESVRAVTPEKTEIQIYVQERSPNGSVRRVPASDLCSHLSAPAQRSQLAAVALDQLHALVAPSAEQLQLYLDNPPAGIDKLIWEQAKKDNPDPKAMIPVPMIGFNELHRRTQCQEQENVNQQRRLDLIASDIADLQKTQAATAARLSQLKRANLELSHRVLQVLVRQEMVRKQGWSIQPHEERLRVQLEALQDELATPTQFKGRLNELLSQTRLQSQQAVQRGERYSLEPAGRDEVRQLLRSQQHGLQQLMAVVQADLADLDTIRHGLEHAPRR